jgi:glycosyltransferase involved in cell wall biosynthesis
MPDKIKILRIFSRLNIGGPAIHTILLTAGLNDDRFESILVKGSEDPYEGNMLYLAKEKGVDSIIIPEMGRNVSLLDDIRAFLKIYHLVKKEKPHIIHTHTAKAGALGRWAGISYNLVTICQSKIKKLNPFRKPYGFPVTSYPVRLVHTFHGHVFYGYFNPLKTYLFLLIERLLGLFTDRIITVSEKQRDEILRFKIGNEKKVISIPLGLELERFLDVERFKGLLRKELGIPLDLKLVGIVARIVPIKNHKMFIEAVSALKETSEVLKVKFLIVGDGELRRQIENYVRKKGLQEDIIFLGFRRDLEIIYADLDLVVLTSLNEGSPVALIEAMAAGRPVISTDVGGVGNLLSSKFEAQNSKSHLKYCKEGILIKSGDVDELARAMKELLENEGLREKMGLEGRKRVYPEYDISRLIEDVRKLYQEIISER